MNEPQTVETSAPEVSVRHVYAADTAPKLGIRMSWGRVQFLNNVWSTEEVDQAKEMDELIAARPNVSKLIRKIDKSGAEKRALEHQKQLRQQASKGAFDSTTARLELRDARLAELANDPQAQADFERQISDEDLLLTQKGDEPGEADKTEAMAGFTPVDEGPKEPGQIPVEGAENPAGADTVNSILNISKQAASGN